MPKKTSPTLSFRSLPKNLQEIVLKLDDNIKEIYYSSHERDVMKEIRDAILSSVPISPLLQEEFVKILANDQRQDKYTLVANAQ